MNEINCNKGIAYLFMIISCVTGIFSYQVFAWSETRTEWAEARIQWNWYIEATKNWNAWTSNREGSNDLVIQPTDWGTQMKDDLRNASPSRQDQPKKTTNWRFDQDYEIGIGHTIRHEWFGIDDRRQDDVQSTFDVGWMDLVIVHECENWNWDMNKKWDQWLAFWFCQAQLWQHPEIDAGKFKTDPQYQIQECARMRKTWTPFYGPDRILSNWNICRDEVVKRFTLANQN